MPLPSVPAVKEDLRALLVKPAVAKTRQYMQRSLGCHVEGCALPMPDAYYGPNKLAAVIKRVGCRPPGSGINVVSLAHEVRDFTRALIAKMGLKPLASGDVASEETWINDISRYPEWRREELRRVLREQVHIRVRHIRCKTFIKTETYEEYKFPRLINSRHDRFKILTGGFFHAIEQQLFQKPMFVKYVPVRERPKYIWEHVAHDGMLYAATDYTSFESWFRPVIMHAIEFQLYAYMAKNLTNRDRLLSLLSMALSGTNRCRSGDDFKFSVNGVRMSGDMCTSLGNGFTNYVLMKWICHRQGIECRGLVEGDDGIFAVSREPDTTDLAELGFKIKMNIFKDLGAAGFCKQFFDPSDFHAVVDVRSLLAKFGWTHAVLRNGGPVVMEQLLRAKAASLRCEVPSCPIAVALVRMVDRCIGLKGPVLGEGPGGVNTYMEDERMQGGPAELTDPTPASRALVAKLFGVTVAQQIAIEKYLDGITQLQPLGGPVLEIMKREWFDYYSKYGRVYSPQASIMW